MAWLTANLRLDSRKAAADIAETVWHLVDPESQLACAWAIDCARRGADEDEMAAAAGAAGAAWAAAGAAWDAGAARKDHADIMRKHFTWQQIDAAIDAALTGQKEQT